LATPEKRDQVIRMFEGLRLTDVCDAMDAVGLQDTGTMDNEIRPLWRDVEGFKHRIYGFALTVRFVPTNRRAPSFSSLEEHFKWKRDWYRELANDHLRENIKAGDVIVIDAAGTEDVGFIGSNNSLAWTKAGAKGIVTNAGCRDTDEIIKQKIPVYSRYISRGIRPGRLESESTNKPINCGGVLVRPEDVVVADGDGVIVVPLEKAQTVAGIAVKIHESDKEGRRKLYEELGIPRDFTVEARKLQ